MKYINPSCTTVINLYQHTWLLIEKPSFKLANTPSSTCFPSPNITNLSESSTETAKGMNKWETFSRQAKQDTILLRDTSPSCKPCRPNSCFIMLSDSNRTQPNNPSFMSPKHPLLSWNSLSWKVERFSLLRNVTEHSRCGSVLHAGKILRLLRHNQGSTCWGLFEALLPEKIQESNKPWM